MGLRRAPYEETYRSTFLCPASEGSQISLSWFVACCAFCSRHLTVDTYMIWRLMENSMNVTSILKGSGYQEMSGGIRMQENSNVKQTRKQREREREGHISTMSAYIATFKVVSTRVTFLIGWSRMKEGLTQPAGSLAVWLPSEAACLLVCLTCCMSLAGSWAVWVAQLFHSQLFNFVRFTSLCFASRLFHDCSV